MSFKERTVEIKLTCLVDGEEAVNYEYKATTNHCRDAVNAAVRAHDELIAHQKTREKFEMLLRLKI